MFSKEIKRAVSPVVGVILLVALTVGLVGLVAFFVTDLFDDTAENPDVTVDYDVNNEEVIVLRNGNADEIIVGTSTVTEAGETLDVSGLNDGDTFSVTATVDGEEQVVQTFEYVEP